MRPSSSRSEPPASSPPFGGLPGARPQDPPAFPAPYGGLLGALPGDPPVDAVLGDRSLVAAMLRAEAALAAAQVTVGLVPAAAAEVIGRVAGSRDYDPGELGIAAAASGNPVVPLAAWLTRDVAAQDEDAARWVHHGATSQDILDTALMLVADDALSQTLHVLDRCCSTLVLLATRHASTLMAGRTLGQLAAPTTFGLTVTGWLTGVDAAAVQLRASRSRLAVQLGGPVGTGVAWGPRLPEVLGAFAAATGLRTAPPWHTDRSRVVQLAASLGQAVIACAKIATDVVTLSQNEIGELREGATAGRGGSSAMPHKHNPVGSVLIRSAAVRAPGLVASVLSAAVHEGQRATGAWHAEWSPLRELLHLAGGATAATADVLEGLEVREQAMADRVAGAGSVMFAESVSRALGGALGRAAAQDVVGAAARTAEQTGSPFRELLEADDRVTSHLDPAALGACFDPGPHVRAAAGLVALTLSRRNPPEDR
jgi:3-carboxy-cis,cis-muconate cycloisomerase